MERIRGFFETVHFEEIVSSEWINHAGVVVANEQLLAFNRPESEDGPATVTPDKLGELFAGLDFHVIQDQLGSEAALASENKFVSIYDIFEFFDEASLTPSFLSILPKYFNFFEKQFFNKFLTISNDSLHDTAFVFPEDDAVCPKTPSPDHPLKRLMPIRRKPRVRSDRGIWPSSKNYTKRAFH